MLLKIPKFWKHSHVSPLIKKTPPLETYKYCIDFCLCFCFGRPFEKNMKSNMVRRIEANSSIPMSQYFAYYKICRRTFQIRSNSTYFDVFVTRNGVTLKGCTIPLLNLFSAEIVGILWYKSAIRKQNADDIKS